jgi:hypothetical protein
MTKGFYQPCVNVFGWNEVLCSVLRHYRVLPIKCKQQGYPHLLYRSFLMVLAVPNDGVSSSKTMMYAVAQLLVSSMSLAKPCFIGR